MLLDNLFHRLYHSYIWSSVSLLWVCYRCNLICQYSRDNALVSEELCGGISLSKKVKKFIPQSYFFCGDILLSLAWVLSVEVAILLIFEYEMILAYISGDVVSHYIPILSILYTGVLASSLSTWWLVVFLAWSDVNEDMDYSTTLLQLFPSVFQHKRKIRK